ncbi:hypothetical protein Purlil1_11222 [Purpureocillium lilacinum]|uniref:Uncharacterized protein n=1 Tax=Purpureocillium lilacinum TaxID=33203 RepID=A0ABR0BKD9_PURLI|nr:hypothetical protein Purlil1_11222 [Purpureocillium lilacinum]
MDYSLGGNGQKSPSSEPHWRCLPPSGLVRAFTVIGGHIIERPVPAAPVASLAACHVTAASPAFRPFCPDVKCPSQSSGLIGPQGASRIAARLQANEASRATTRKRLTYDRPEASAARNPVHFLNDFTLPDDTATTGHEVRIPAYSHTREYHHISPVDSNDIGRGLTSGLLRRKDRSHDEEQNSAEGPVFAGGAREPLQPVQLSSLNHELALPENFHPTPPCAEPQLHGLGSCATVAPEVPRRYPGLDERLTDGCVCERGCDVALARGFQPTEELWGLTRQATIRHKHGIARVEAMQAADGSQRVRAQTLECGSEHSNGSEALTWGQRAKYWQATAPKLGTWLGPGEAVALHSALVSALAPAAEVSLASGLPYHPRSSRSCLPGPICPACSRLPRYPARARNRQGLRSEAAAPSLARANSGRIIESSTSQVGMGKRAQAESVHRGQRASPSASSSINNPPRSTPENPSTVAASKRLSLLLPIAPCVQVLRLASAAKQAAGQQIEYRRVTPRAAHVRIPPVPDAQDGAYEEWGSPRVSAISPLWTTPDF